MKKLCHGLSADETGSSIKLLIQADLIREVQEDVTYLHKNVLVDDCYGLGINTTETTSLLKQSENMKIDCSKDHLASDKKKLCCPDISSYKVNSLFECINLLCKKKVNQHPSEAKLICDFCNMKMLTKNLNKIINVELHGSEKESSCNQHYLTIFPEVLQKSFNIADKSIDQIEDFLLDCNKTDIINKGKK